MKREAGLSGGGLLEAGLGGVIEGVVAQAAGGRRGSEWTHGVSGALACCGFALAWHADVANWLVVR